MINLERLIFLIPNSIINFDININKNIYQPGDSVELKVTIPNNSSNPDEEYYASITVTDISSFLEVMKH